MMANNFNKNFRKGYKSTSIKKATTWVRAFKSIEKTVSRIMEANRLNNPAAANYLNKVLVPTKANPKIDYTRPKAEGPRIMAIAKRLENMNVKQLNRYTLRKARQFDENNKDFFKGFQEKNTRNKAKILKGLDLRIKNLENNVTRNYKNDELLNPINDQIKNAKTTEEKKALINDLKARMKEEQNREYNISDILTDELRIIDRNEYYTQQTEAGIEGDEALQNWINEGYRIEKYKKDNQKEIGKMHANYLAKLNLQKQTMANLVMKAKMRKNELFKNV